MHIERMEETIALLRRVHKTQSRRKRKFSYKTWGGPAGSVAAAYECKTTACAGGEMALYKPFQEQGLLPESDTCFAPTLKVGRTKHYGRVALSRFLGIDHSVAWTAFCGLHTELGLSSRSDVTARHVADYLQSLLDAYRASRRRRAKS